MPGRASPRGLVYEICRGDRYPRATCLARLKYKVDLVQGLQNVIPAMNRPLTEANTGKVIVRLAS